MNKNPFTTIVLAAGKGTRMKSVLPKVLHPVAGVPMIQKVIQAVKASGGADIRVVVGHGRELVQKVVEPLGAHCFVQEKQMGTGDAVKAAKIDSIDGDVLIINGDHPLIRVEDIKGFWDDFRESEAGLCVVTTEVENPGSFGRIVRSGGSIKAIVEAKDASSDTLKIREINTGIYLMSDKVLKKYLPQISNNNAQAEYYLTDIISLALEQSEKVSTLHAKPHVAFGVNDQRELAEATRLLFKAKAEKLMFDGVTIIDPATTYIEDSVQIGPSSVVFPGCYLRGRTRIGSLVSIEPNCYIVNSTIGDSVEIKAGSYFEDVHVGNNCRIGPYARLRPETDVADDVHIGNFVELKKVRIGKGSKANHLTYLGDAEIGENVNIGCGTITCNYAVDRKKYKTTIGNNVFVGSDTQFIAPITIGDNAVIGSGSTVTKDVPARALAVARGKQVIKENYVSASETRSSSTPKKES